MSGAEPILPHAGDLLSTTWGREVVLGAPSHLESPSTVLRAAVQSSGLELPSSVIIKRVTDRTFDRPGHDGPPQRFLNEWAALYFLTSLGVGDEVCPRFLAADEDLGLLIVSDVGEASNLENLLLAGRDAGARAALTELGRSLGRLQVEAKGGERDFREIQRSLGTDSPRCDSTVDQRGREELFRGCLDALGLASGTGFWEAVVDVESSIHDAEQFRSMIHGDAGPQNLLVGREDVTLIDFEYAVFRNGLCDVVGARLGFPQTSLSMRVPAEDARRLESAYRETVAEAIPEVEDDGRFFPALTAAAAHWALNRWAAGWLRQVRPALDDVKHGLDMSGLARTLLVLEGFTALADETGHLLGLAATVDSYRRELMARWPELEAPGTYPALRNA